MSYAGNAAKLSNAAKKKLSIKEMFYDNYALALLRNFTIFI